MGFESVENLHPWATRLERLALGCVIAMAVAVPHSIAAAQTMWILGSVVTAGRFLVRPRPAFKWGLLETLFAAFFIWSVVTAVFSYAPDISFSKLRNVSLFLVLYFVILNIKSVRSALIVATVLISSTMVAVVWTPVERLIGRGVEVHGLAPNSPLLRAVPDKDEQPISEGRAVIEVNGRRVHSPEALLTELDKSEKSRLRVYHTDYYSTVTVRRDELLPGTTPLERLGISEAKRSHDWRSAGFYGHYVTFAEVLQLIGALAFGLLVSLTVSVIEKRETLRAAIPRLALLAVSVAGIAFALLLTVTRASQAAFIVAISVVVFLCGNRKLILLSAAMAIPLLIGGVYVLQKSRNVGFVDTKDNSTTWRMTVYREGAGLWTGSPRNFILGVGMDSIQRYKDEWGLFDNGRLPPGHFHSTPLQLAVERGLPALLLWLAIVGVLFRSMYATIRNSEFGIGNSKLGIPHPSFAYGLLLGCLGALVGFFTSGLVHYNLGDGEVAMVFFMLMGIGRKIDGGK